MTVNTYENNKNPNNNNESGANSSNGNFSNNYPSSNSFVKKDNKDWDNIPKINPDDVNLYKPYIMTSGRDVPKHIVEQMVELSRSIKESGYVLRIGGLEGGDNVLGELDKDAELYLPWKNFSDKVSKLYFSTEECLALASKFNAKFNEINNSMRSFLGMYTRMVLGKDLKSRVNFIICWTPDGAEDSSSITTKTGLIAQAIGIASAMKIPVFNLNNADTVNKIKTYIGI